MSGGTPTTGGAGGADGGIDKTNLNKASSDAKALYGAIQEAAVQYEKETAGAKLGKDKAKAISG